MFLWIQKKGGETDMEQIEKKKLITLKMLENTEKADMWWVQDSILHVRAKGHKNTIQIEFEQEDSTKALALYHLLKAKYNDFINV